MVLGLIMGMGLFVSKTKSPGGGGGSEVGAGCAGAPDATLADGARDTVANGITAASTGDCIQLPASCSATWTSGITVAKAITVDFNGCTITRNFASGALISVNPPTGLTVLTRITNGIFNGEASVDNNQTAYLGITFGVDARVRVDHSTFSCTDFDPIYLRISHDDYFEGVLDNNTFNVSVVGIETVHNEAYGFSSTDGWAYALTQGSADALYLEDNTFNWNSGSAAGSTSAIQNYYGSRTVFRYNDVDSMKFDNHGTGGNIGGRWYEIYQNHWFVNVDLAAAIELRAGSGVVFDNTLHNESGAAGSRNIDLEEEDSGAYPLLYQVGRGQDQALDPLYIWGNVVQNDGGGTGGFTVGITEETGGTIVEDRDYYLEEKVGYTAYTYPHELRFVAQ